MTNMLIAIGSNFKDVPSFTINKDKIVSSIGILKLKKIPQRLLMIGRGYIGLEMAYVWGCLGTEITVMEFKDEIFPCLNAEIRKAFQQILAQM
jgi:dihydrolipoamide dehydrogenase